MAEGSFEAKLTAKRETAAGIYLTIQVQPDDYRAELATLRVGSALVLGWAEVVDTAVVPIVAEPAYRAAQAQESERVGAAVDAIAKQRRPFDTLPLSQQAAIRCGDNDFKLFLGASNAEDAANIVRAKCQIASRSELDDQRNKQAARYCWEAIEAGYQQWLTTQRYADMRRWPAQNFPPLSALVHGIGARAAVRNAGRSFFPVTSISTMCALMD